jgi:hypothetical protein
MRLFANNPVLIDPILKYLWLNGQNVEVKDFSTENWKWKLTLDIWWKIITLKAWMKFWFFTQCVNHTVILDGISAETQDGTSVTFNSGVWENGRYVEGDMSTILSTTEVGASVSVIVHNEQEQWPKKPTNQTGSDPSNWEIPTNPDGTIPEQEGHPIGEGTDNSSQPTNWGAGWSSDNIWTEWEQRWWEGATNDEYDDF